MKLKTLAFLAGLLFTVAAVPTVGGAQTVGGRVRGSVVDWQHAVIQRASVVFESHSFRKEAETNEEGTYDVELPAGTYTVKVRQVGFHQRRMKVRVGPGVTKSLSFMLDVKPMNIRCPRGSICL